MRIVTAAPSAASTTAGRMSCFGSQQPPEGSQCSFEAKRKISTRANQKFGIPIPAMLTPVMAWSTIELRRAAASATIVTEEIPYRLAGDQRGTQVSAGKILQIDAVLHPNRLVESKPLAIGLAHLLGHGRTEHASSRITRCDTEPIEDSDRRHYQDDRRAKPSADKIGAHVLDQPVSTVSSLFGAESCACAWARACAWACACALGAASARVPSKLVPVPSTSASASASTAWPLAAHSLEYGTARRRE